MLFATMYCNIIFLMNYAVLPHHIIIYITLGCVIMDSREPQQDLTCSGSELVAGHVVRVAAHKTTTQPIMAIDARIHSADIFIIEENERNGNCRALTMHKYKTKLAKYNRYG